MALQGLKRFAPMTLIFLITYAAAGMMFIFSLAKAAARPVPIVERFSGWRR
jgi:hypothetical protein